MKTSILLLAVLSLLGCKTDSVKSFRNLKKPYNSGFVNVSLHLTEGQVSGDLRGYITVHLQTNVEVESVAINNLKVSNETVDLLLVKKTPLSQSLLDDDNKPPYNWFFHSEVKPILFEEHSVTCLIKVESSSQQDELEISGKIESKVLKKNSYISNF